MLNLFMLMCSIICLFNLRHFNIFLQLIWLFFSNCLSFTKWNLLGFCLVASKLTDVKPKESQIFVVNQVLIASIFAFSERFLFCVSSCTVKVFFHLFPVTCLLILCCVSIIVCVCVCGVTVWGDRGRVFALADWASVRSLAGESGTWRGYGCV